MPRAKILVIAPFSIAPPHFGSSDRTYNLVRGLAQTFEVILLHTDYAQIKAARSNADIPNVRTIKAPPAHRLAQICNPFLLIKGWQLIQREKPVLLLGEHFFSGGHTLCLHYLSGVPYILDEHNAEYIRYRRMKRLWARGVAWVERLYCQAAAGIMCVSEVDKRLLQELGVNDSKMAVVINGIDLEQYKPNPVAREAIRQTLGLTEDTPLVLFFGKLDYQPNAEAIEIIVREIMPRVLAQLPTARFVICGYHPPVEAYTHSNLIFTGMVPAIEDYINAADMVIVPLISGGGTKFKIMQAIACGRQVITTSIGAEGISQAGDWMLVADDWSQFSQLVCHGLTQKPRLSLSTWEAFRSAYSQERMLTQAVELISSTTTSRQGVQMRV